MKMINDQGGVNGRKINLISLDDGYVPPRTVEQTRRLVEQDGVALIFGSLGTATNTAIVRYLNERKIPQLFLGSGATSGVTIRRPRGRWGECKASFRTEARIYARYILEKVAEPQDRNPLPERRFRSRLRGRRKGCPWRPVQRDREGSDLRIHRRQPSIRRSTSLQGSGATRLIVAASPKFAAQSIRKVYDIGWKPMFFMTNVAIWISTRDGTGRI